MSVYTSVDKHELQTFLKEYNLGTLVDYQGIQDGIENTNYFVNTTQGRYVLTIFEHHTAEELNFFLDFLTHLAKNNVLAPAPAINKNGEKQGILKDKPATFVSRLDGSTLKKQATLEQCKTIGTALAQFHLAGQNFPQSRLPDCGHDWRIQTGETLLQQIEGDDKQLLENELAYQRQQYKTELPQGIIHADLFLDNVMFDGETLTGILDIYYACKDDLLYDIAVVVNDWCFDEKQLNSEKVTTLLSSYHTIRPLTDEEKHSWPATLRAAALRFWLSRLSDSLAPRKTGELMLQKDPAEYRDKLSHHINNNNTSSLWIPLH